VRAALVALCWFVASLATAAVGHLALEFWSRLGTVDGFASHPHGSVIPVAVASVALTALAVVRSFARAIGRSCAEDPAMILARRFERMSPLAPALCVGAGGIAVLGVMELAEQIAANGRIVSVGEAFGENAALAVLVVAIIGALIAIVGLRSARALVASAVAAARLLAGWVLAVPNGRAFGRTVTPRARGRAGNAPSDIVPRSFGLRAPPPTFA
jgi:hypothetical protein